MAPPTELSVAGLVGRCLDEPHLGPSTDREWRSLRAEIEPSSIGPMRATDLQRRHVKAWSMEIKVRSAQTANHAFEVLGRAYSLGRREELVEANPCSGMPKPH